MNKIAYLNFNRSSSFLHQHIFVSAVVNCLYTAVCLRFLKSIMCLRNWDTDLSEELWTCWFIFPYCNSVIVYKSVKTILAPVCPSICKQPSAIREDALEGIHGSAESLFHERYSWSNGITWEMKHRSCLVQLCFYMPVFHFQYSGFREHQHFLCSQLELS